MAYTAIVTLAKYLRTNRRPITRAAAVVIVVAALINIAVAAFFDGRTYPNARLDGKSVGNMSRQDLAAHLQNRLPAKVKLLYGPAEASYSLEQLGIAVDESAVTNQLFRNHWLPVMNLFSSHDANFALKADGKKLSQVLTQLNTNSTQTTQKIDTTKAQPAILEALKLGGSRITLPTLSIEPAKLNITSVPQPAAKPAKKTFTYCTAVKGVDQSYLVELEAKLANVYADARGWNLGGDVSFVKAANNCNFTVWLSAADQMPSFGAICDSTWSCAVSPNVVLNFDRWQGASAAWTGGGGGLEDYRTMVVNHETGHWLGFYHSDCKGAGQPAPVMQQQSIDMQGCAVNPWPRDNELAQLRKYLKL